MAEPAHAVVHCLGHRSAALVREHLAGRFAFESHGLLTACGQFLLRVIDNVERWRDRDTVLVQEPTGAATYFTSPVIESPSALLPVDVRSVGGKLGQQLGVGDSLSGQCPRVTNHNAMNLPGYGAQRLLLGNETSLHRRHAVNDLIFCVYNELQVMQQQHDLRPSGRYQELSGRQACNSIT